MLRADQLLAGLVHIARLGDNLVAPAQELSEVLGQLLQRDVGFLDQSVVELGMVVAQRRRARQVVEIELALPEERPQPERHLTEAHLQLLADLELHAPPSCSSTRRRPGPEREQDERDHHQRQPGGDTEANSAATPSTTGR